MLKKIVARFGNEHMHWVGDGFPVRSLFSYHALGSSISPFLLMDYAGPFSFQPSSQRRGVGQHPHRGFETVTIVYSGEVEHRDSGGNGGVIGPGDVQWMTAGRGVLHEEFHSANFSRTGGLLRMVQLWVNLPAKDKMGPARYQSIANNDIPIVELSGNAGTLRVIAGEYGPAKGPARTHTPISVWDVQLHAGHDVLLSFPPDQTALVAILDGEVIVANAQSNKPEIFLLDGEQGDLAIKANTAASILVLVGEPIDEPIVGHGPFVMNTATEIQQAMRDVQTGLFGRMPVARA
jgi:redox-sensitive bicupin YhaK (pirin superfamily)